MDHSDPESRNERYHRSRTNIAFVGFLALAGFYLVTEHRAHLLGWLPWLLLLACPLMHVFMHGGHRRGGGASGSGVPDERGTSTHRH